jgi:MFS family permease
MVLLGTATFFEGYDTGIAAVVIPDLARDFHVANNLLGSPVSIVNLGALFRWARPEAMELPRSSRKRWAGSASR